MENTAGLPSEHQKLPRKEVVMSYTVTILAMPNSFASSLTGAMDFLEVANRVANKVLNIKGDMFRVRILSQGGQPVLCSNRHQISVDGSLAEHSGGDLLLIPALPMGTEDDLKAAIPEWKPYLDWIHQHHSRFDVISSHCSGAFVLAETGLLDGHEATTSWWLTKIFERYYPKVNLRPEQVLTDSKPFLICGSTTSNHEMLIKVVERHAGQYAANLLCKFFMLDRMERTQTMYAILPKAQHGDVGIRKAEIAEQAAMSTRTLVRRFHKYYGESPQSYIQRTRIEKSKVLLETTNHRLAKIVELCGYGDESAFRRLFKKYCSISPREYRRRFQVSYQASS